MWSADNQQERLEFIKADIFPRLMPIDLPDKKLYQLRNREIFIPLAGPIMYGIRMYKTYGDESPREVSPRVWIPIIANPAISAVLFSGALRGLEYLL